MTRDDDRLDGWKAIGAFFGRDRSTVMRWTRDRGLPVRSVPGGKTRTVYASRAELAAWAARTDEAEAPVAPPPVAPAAAVPVDAPAIPRWHRAVPIALVAPAALAILIALAPHAPRGPTQALPRDPTIAAIYLRGRDAWGQRTAAGMGEAVAAFERVTRADPGFAPAFAALADAELLMREYGASPSAAADARARQAAQHAARLDPSLPAAWRALGFIAYWLDHDRAAAGAHFRKALALDPADAQTHLWFAAALTDNGDYAAALRHYDEARLRDPGSVAIRTERAWLLWSAGQTGAAKAEFAAIAAERPDHAVLHECLSMIALTEGDFPRHLSEMQARARLRGEPEFTAYVTGLERAWRQGGVAALRTATLRHGKVAGYDDALPALYASVAGDRAEVLRLLRAAEARHEVWGWSGYRRWMAQRWAGDGEVVPLLARRAPEPL